jgi:hypothetical protein
VKKAKIPKYDIWGKPVSLRQYTRIRLTELNQLHQRSIEARGWTPKTRREKKAWEVCFETEHSCEDIISLLQDLLKDTKWGRGIEYEN